MALKKREFTPESGTVDTYVTGQLSYLQHNSWHLWISFIIILVLPPGVVCSSNRALPMPGTADGDAVSHCQVMGRAGSVHHGADQ